MKKTIHDRGFSWLPVWIPAALCVICIGVFYPALRAGFVNWDDDTEILANPHIAGFSAENVKWAFTNYERTRRYQPLDWLSWQLNYQVGALSPWGYHFGNLLEHLICVLLLYFMVLRILRAWRTGGIKGEGTSLYWAAGLGTLWWAIHPLRAEPVAWVTGRIYTQCTMFLLGAFLTYLMGRDENFSTRGRRALYWTSVALFACSLLSYAIVVGAAFAFLLLDIYPLRRVGRWSAHGWRSAAARRVLWEKAPYFAAALAVGIVTLWARVHVTGIWDRPKTLAEFSLFSRAMQAFYTWAYYLIVPWFPFHLSPVYTRLFVFNPNDAVFWASIVLVIALSWGAWKWRDVFPAFAMAWIYHLVMLVPLLGLTEHPHYTNDRYAQMEGLVFPVLLAGGYVLAMRTFSKPLWKRCINVAAGMTLACLGILCFAQTTVWQNTETLFTYMLSELGGDPYRADIQWRLANFYLVNGRVGEAIPLLRESLNIDPRNHAALHLAGIAYKEAGDWTKARNMEQSKRDAFYLEAAEMFDREAAAAHDVQALRLAAACYAAARQWGSAEDRANGALLLEPGDAATRIDLAGIYHAEHKTTEALEQLNLAVQADPRTNAARAKILAEWGTGH